MALFAYAPQIRGSQPGAVEELENVYEERLT
jgi:hypothetical protein